jgi:hypothetical protein
MCKYYKYAGFGDAVRIPVKELRKMGGKLHRVSRKDISDQDRYA